ncbi:MAG: prolipoprotein diacylglyceryl transferase [Rhodospirillales bacterium]|nr:prolipoprotein diacylglyceryl transferase [Rhodospirillales bacterium]
MALSFPDIDPVAVALGPLEIRWYALAYLAGFLMGWRYALYIAGLTGKGISREDVDDFLPWAILGVILGGRIGYVLFYQFDLYLDHPLEILKIWHGGMSFHGGASGVIAAMIAYSFARKLPLLHFTDMICCVVPIGLFFGRLANFVNAELYGRVTAVPWGIIFPGGGDLPRHPSQLYEALLEGLVLTAVMAVLLHRPAIREKAGLLSGVFLIGYALSRFTVEFFREPDPQIGYLAGYFTMGQLLSLPMLLGGLLLIFLAVRRQPVPAHD